MWFATRLQNISFPWDHKLTLSIGIATSPPEELMSAKELLDAADKAVYWAKENGRNQVKHVDAMNRQ